MLRQQKQYYNLRLNARSRHLTWPEELSFPCSGRSFLSLEETRTTLVRKASYVEPVLSFRYSAGTPQTTDTAFTRGCILTYFSLLHSLVMLSATH